MSGVGVKLHRPSQKGDDGIEKLVLQQDAKKHESDGGQPWVRGVLVIKASAPRRLENRHVAMGHTHTSPSPASNLLSFGALLLLPGLNRER